MVDDKKDDGIEAYKVQYDSDLPSKVRIPTDYEKEQMFQMFRRGTNLKDIAEHFELNPKSVSKYKKDGDWEGRQQRELEERQKLEKTEVEDIAKESYTKLLKIVFKLISDFEQYVFEGVEKGSPVPLKVLTDAVEKLTKLHYFSANGGAERVKTEATVRNVTEKIDYAELAKVHLEAKRLNPNYDEKALLKDVVDASYKKLEKK